MIGNNHNDFCLRLFVFKFHMNNSPVLKKAPHSFKHYALITPPLNPFKMEAVIISKSVH